MPIIFEIQITNATGSDAAAPAWSRAKARQGKVARSSTLRFLQVVAGLQLVCIENLLLRSLAATGMAGDGDGEASETIYGIAAIVANCKCCGKQVN